MESAQDQGLSTDRASLKREALHVLSESLNKLVAADSYIFLQYGSSLFGSETKDSDFDIIILTTLATLSSR